MTTDISLTGVASIAGRGNCQETGICEALFESKEVY